MELIGRTLLERYRIEGQLGRGGMAEVYLAWDGLRSTHLALKVLHEELAMDRVFIRRFQREAQTLKRLQHPNIVRFYGLEESENLAFMVLDYIQGKSLKHWIYSAAGPLNNEQIRHILKPTLGALQFAHQSGFIHCDMKPGNILIEESGRVLVSDFGISRMQDEATATMVGFGTPAYMAPEQVTIAILVGVFGWVRELTPKEPNDLMMEMTEGLVNKSETPSSLIESSPMGIPSEGNLWLSLKDNMLLAKIPAGEFQMGSNDGGKDEKPLHMVFLDDFWIDTTEVTNAQYEKCVAAGECYIPSPIHSNTRSVYYGNPEYSEFPVIYVAWRDAKAYCNWAGRRLPTEAEWEKAARGGLEEKDYPWGDDLLSCQLEADTGANYWRCNGEDTFRVGSFKANRYGLFDMSGNVWEWVSDWYDPNYYAIAPAQNPTEPASSVINRVLRGGSFVDDAFSLRVASRHYKNHLLRFNFVGFRCAASITP